ncbi:Rho GTPase activating protein, variant 2 [Purpureocillium takamizusanense]|uniref:Rho GTPase activating protein, variant 2 n=1 Tax=Purpureocillium takamizusanense TaxID=2060973 RepID=A0A9Q8VCU4_9HYPO|nr:Rho GTPase activating protein, variant 2 [Purpureocillium takamizusanense]UNI21018.1 Rho GTPase activating protein, variant 2 [Purpureocillium takamizusanense]
MSLSCDLDLLAFPLLMPRADTPRRLSRSPRPPIPSPLSTASNVAPSPSRTSPRHPTSPSSQGLPSPIGQGLPERTAPSQEPVGQTAFYSDSSAPSTPDEEIPRLTFANTTNDTRSVSDPVASRPTPSQGRSPPRVPKPPMAAPVMAATGEVPKGTPRNASIDTTISTASSTLSLSKGSGSPSKPIDVAGLIKTAGSPEAVIEHLLKEKQSQAQQNSQLWRLVDKQRAMILGLNKDLESALKDKERYRKKLKELMANPAVMKAAGGPRGDPEPEPEPEPTGRRGPPGPRVDVDVPTREPDSPSLDSDSQKNSPIDITMAPYPITPPADRQQVPHSAVGEILDPRHIMPKPQEHALDKFDHEAEERAADEERKERKEESLREIPYNVSLPPSRSLPSDPPSVPPPKPPLSPPLVTIMEPTPQPDEGLGKFPAPQRKAPPAPLQLSQQARKSAAPPEDDDSDSDYDDILDVGHVGPEPRGRRRTREEDDREREIIAFREEQERSASKKSKSSQARLSAETSSAPDPKAAAALLGQAHGDVPPSLDAMLHVDHNAELAPPLRSPGLPVSPRPFGNAPKTAASAASLSPRSGNSATLGPPMSPRPPRQAIPLPPNTPLVSPAMSGGSPSAQATNAGSRADDATDAGVSGKGRSATAERTKIFRGLVTDEFPDLLLPPNALPSIQVKVASSRMKPSRASLMSLTQLEEDPVFTLAIASRADGGELWRVEKDIASLSKLDQRLKQCPAVTAKTPDRSLFSGHAPAKLDARRVALEQYLDELLDTPLDATTAVELCKYLSSNTLPPNADETGSALRSSPETGSFKIGTDGRPIRSGYLTKKGKNFGGWKARFFIIEGPHLKYYETPGGAHLGTIKLQNAQIGKQSQASNEVQSPSRLSNGEELDNQYRHAFLILEPKKKDSHSHVKHVLCAESDKERDSWVDVLLQWIDYRDPDDPDAKSSKGASNAHDRQGSGHEHSNGAKAKKNNQGRPNHQPAESDTLIGVRYDTTHAGETPQGVPGGPRSAMGLPEHYSSHNLAGETMSSQSNKIISAPKDPQVISDSAAWGNKQGLSIPTNDEKKARKRSFFGFGPKTRSSSDGQDSLFGGSEAGSAATPPQASYHGPVRQVFGAPLAEAVRYNPPVDVNVPLPSVVFRCIQYLDHKDAILEEGIFRLSGSNVVIKQLRERFNNEGDINLVTDEHYHDIHAVASLLKLYLRELPTTILTRDLHLDFLATTEITDRKEKITTLAELARRLPQANATLLKYLISFLIKIINNADMNKMNVRNVGIVFSPTLNIPAPVFAMFLQNYEAIFGVDPEHYELPSPMPESDSQHGRVDGPPRLDPPARPSTSGSASPHRQPRMDSMRDHARQTPTPPLLQNLQTARGSPTPPLGTARSQYDLGHSIQYNTTSSVSSRPAYESVYGVPAGSEASGFHPAPRAAPGYDRPIYPSVNDEQGPGSSQAQEQPQNANTNAKRRESLVYMGGLSGLQHHGSKSRLREEARF